CSSVIDSIGSCGVERTSPVKLIAAPAPLAAARNTLVSAPGSKASDCKRTRIRSPTRHGRKQRHRSRAPNTCRMLAQFLLNRGADHLAVFRGQRKSFITLGEIIHQLRDRSNAFGQIDLVAVPVEPLAEPGEIQHLHDLSLRWLVTPVQYCQPV